jgi:hypothetical protein
MWFCLFIFFLLLSVALGFACYRLAVRLLQFDEVFSSISPVLQMYGEELLKMSKGDLLIDHPEVRAFHQLNVGMLKSLEFLTNSVTSVKPKPKKPALPRPVVV